MDPVLVDAEMRERPGVVADRRLVDVETGRRPGQVDEVAHDHQSREGADRANPDPGAPPIHSGFCFSHAGCGLSLADGGSEVHDPTLARPPAVELTTLTSSLSSGASTAADCPRLEPTTVQTATAPSSAT